MFTAFLARVKPVSTMANPACIHITRNAAISVQTVSRSMDLLSNAACTSCAVSVFAAGESDCASAASVGHAKRMVASNVRRKGSVWSRWP